MSYEQEMARMQHIIALVAKKKEEMPPLHASVAALIPYGRGHARTVSEIASLLNLTGDARRRIHTIIEDLIFTYELPIGGSSDAATKGIFYCVDRGDQELAAKTLNSRAMRILERHRKLIKIFSTLDNGTLDI